MSMKNQEVKVFALALASLTFGPFTSIPGVLIGRRLQNRGALGQFGYVACWFFTVIYGLAIVIGVLAGLTFPLWRGLVR